MVIQIRKLKWKEKTTQLSVYGESVLLEREPQKANASILIGEQGTRECTKCKYHCNQCPGDKEEN